MTMTMMISEFLALPSSLVLGLLLGPIALVIVCISYLKLIWRVGTNFPNVSRFVSLDNAFLMDPTLAMSAKQLSSKIRDPDDPLTAESLLEMFISQCSRVNPLTQSVVGTRYSHARQEAKAIDRLVQESQIPRGCSEFWGVPIVVKECFEMEGMPFTGGLLGRKDVVGLTTGPVISKVQHEGAIVFASTNTSEACMYHESLNHIYGTTHNPYDLRRTAGGSSGGCAAAVASCCAPFAVTSDVGGSTRIPALYNCLFGHKPTGGAISNQNTFPLVGARAVNRFCQLGPTCRHSEDLWPLLQSMLSRDAASPLVDETISSPLDYSGLTIHICLRNLTCSWLSSSVHPEVIAGIIAASKHFETLGARVEHDFDQRPEVREMFQLVNAFRIWAALMSHNKHEPFSKTIRGGLSDVLFWPLEIVLSMWDLSKNTFPAVALAVLESMSDLSFMENENRAMREMGERLKLTLNDILKPNPEDTKEVECEKREGVIFLPSLPTPAPFHSESLLRIFDTANTSFFNVMELPATAVPLGLTHHVGHTRMPIGFQIVGASGRDRVTIALAEELERSGLCHWEPPASFA